MEFICLTVGSHPGFSFTVSVYLPVGLIRIVVELADRLFDFKCMGILMDNVIIGNVHCSPRYIVLKL